MQTSQLTTPVIIAVIIESSTDGFIVSAVWSGVDSSKGSGTFVRTRRLADRLVAAINAGAAITFTEILRTNTGRTFVAEHRNFLARTLNADLKRLGY